MNKSFNRILKEIKNIRYHRYDKVTGESYLIIPKKEKENTILKNLY